MSNLKIFVKLASIACCLLILAFSSFQAVNGQKGQLPDKRRGATEDYVLIEGDIQVSPDFYKEILAARLSPNAAPIRFSARLWPGGIVPFEFNSNVSADNRTKMIDAMSVLEGVANVDFVQCENNNCGNYPYAHIRDSDGNNSRIGMFISNTGVVGQTINIKNWDSKFILVHELMHCLGFFHEQSRSDRGNFIRTNSDNVQDDKGHNFEIKDDATSYGDYDFDSVMHYSQCGFSRNPICPIPSADFPDGGVTITVLPPNDTVWQSKIGQRNHLSVLDQASVSFLYPAPDWRFLDVAYDGQRGSSNGSFLKPYTSFAEAVANTPEGGTLWFLRTQTIPAVGTYSKRITVKAAPNVEAILGD